MRKLVFGLLGFAALGVGALSVQPPLLRTSLLWTSLWGLSPRPPRAPVLGRVPASLERLPLGAPSDRGLPHGR